MSMMAKIADLLERINLIGKMLLVIVDIFDRHNRPPEGEGVPPALPESYAELVDEARRRFE